MKHDEGINIEKSIRISWSEYYYTFTNSVNALIFYDFSFLLAASRITPCLLFLSYSALSLPSVGKFTLT
jgi:hypothetical protein